MSGDWVPKSVLMISEINSLIATSGLKLHLTS